VAKKQLNIVPEVLCLPSYTYYSHATAHSQVTTIPLCLRIENLWEIAFTADEVDCC